MGDLYCGYAYINHSIQQSNAMHESITWTAYHHKEFECLFNSLLYA